MEEEKSGLGEVLANEPAGKTKCTFFDVCGARVIREKIEIQEKIGVAVGEGVKAKNSPQRKWSDRFCFGDFNKCIFFQRRAEDKFNVNHTAVS